MARWYDDYSYFPRSHPRAAKGGIKAQTRRGAFGKNWWAKRWIAVLEGFGIGARLGRGASYARRGQVLSIAIEKGLIKAKVQGSRARPYDVTIKVRVLSAVQWKSLAKKLAVQAIFAAKLLAGEMPQEIEAVFQGAGLSLFPEGLKDLHTDCSCPDWSNPCKHIAAVYYILGEEFDRDPFLILKLRGVSREEMVGLLGGETERLKNSGGRQKPVSCETEADLSLPPEPLSSDLQSFWGRVDLPEDLFGDVRIPPVPAALPRRLGSFPLWRGTEHFFDAMEPFYIEASQRGLEVFL